MNDILSPISASPVVTFGIPGIALAVAVAACVGYAVASRNQGHDVSRTLTRALACVALWSAVVGLVASSGVLLRTDLRPPPFALMFVTLAGAGLWLGFGPVGKRLQDLPIVALVGIHSFRLPLEMSMHQAAVEGVMPVQMSYSGWNFDILTGITAILVALLAAKGMATRSLVIAWNALGTALLVIILTIAVVSSPVLMLFGSEPNQVNTFVARVPFVYLPAVLVIVAITGHVTLWRKLLAAHSGESSLAASGV